MWGGDLWAPTPEIAEALATAWRGGFLSGLLVGVVLGLLLSVLLRRIFSAVRRRKPS